MFTTHLLTWLHIQGFVKSGSFKLFTPANKGYITNKYQSQLAKP